MRSWLSRLSILLIMLALGCQRNEGSTTLTIGVEPMGGGDKMTVNDTIANWTAGDEVWVNGTPYPVSTAGGTHVTVETSNNGYSAIFPASIVSSDGSTITLPDEYQYRTDSYGNQILDLPLAATSENTTLLFQHLTGALVVKLRNDTTIALTVDTVTVSSNGYAISGSRPLNFGNLAATMAARSGSGDDRKVSLLFDEQEVTLAANQSCYVMIPVAAVGNSNRFTIKVSTHNQGTRLDARRTQSNPSAMNCSILAYATMSLHNFLPPLAIFNPSGGYNTYNISSAKDFKNLVSAINQGWTYGGYPYSSFSYKITSDIDMAGDTIAPITGFTGAIFTGLTLNGSNHTISNLTISDNSGYCALFSTTGVNAPIIQYITLNNLRLISNGSMSTRYIGSIIAQSANANINNCNVYNCSVSINGTYSTIIFGGIIARVQDATANVSSCCFESDLTLNSNGSLCYGGIVGRIYGQNSHAISSCSATNDTLILSANSYAHIGGILGNGNTSKPNITSSQWLGNLTATTTTGSLRAGGIIGNLISAGDNGGLTLYRCVVANSSIDASVPASVDSYIGKLYGAGKAPTNSGYSINDCNTANMHIPNSSGMLHTGDIYGGTPSS